MRALGKGLCRLFAVRRGSAAGGLLVFGWRLGADQAIFSVSDQIASAGFPECGDDGLSVFGSEILEKCSLLGFFLFGFRNEDWFFRIRIQACIEHTGGNGSGRGIEVLYLFGMQAFFFEEERELDGILGTASRMRRHEIRNKVLLLVHALCQFVEAVAEFFINFNIRLAHCVQNIV